MLFRSVMPTGFLVPDTIVGNFPETYHNALAENGTKHIWYKKAGGHDVNVMNNALYNFAMRIFRQDAPE